MMKHSEVKEDFKSPYMKKVADRLNIFKMTPSERKEYTAYRNESLKERDYIVSAEEKIAMAAKMLSKGKDIEEIMDFTGLSRKEIKNLESKIKA